MRNKTKKKLIPLVFGERITKDELDFVKDGNDLVVKMKATGDSLRINYWFWSDNYSRFQFKFADGSTLSKADIDSAGYTVEGTNGNDFLRCCSHKLLYCSHLLIAKGYTTVKV